jgi:hypothetical protein
MCFWGEIGGQDLLPRPLAWASLGRPFRGCKPWRGDFLLTPLAWALLGRSLRAHCFARNDKASFKAVSHAASGTQKAWKCAERLGVRQQSCRLAIAASLLAAMTATLCRRGDRGLKTNAARVCFLQK